MQQKYGGLYFSNKLEVVGGQQQVSFSALTIMGWCWLMADGWGMVDGGHKKSHNTRVV